MTKLIPTILTSLTLLILATAGCNNAPLPLQQQFDQVTVGTSTANDVLSMLPDEGMMHTASAVSVYNQHGWAHETGIVHFSPTDSTVLRKDYIQKRSQQSIIFTNESILTQVQTVIPPETLDGPYENDLYKYEAILRYCHQSLIEDSRPFKDDRPTESLTGMGRMVLASAITALNENRRQAADLIGPQGFAFRHPTLGKCRLFLKQNSDTVFTVTIQGADWVDPFMTW